MKKIPTIFKRDPENPSRVMDEVNPDCGWVFSGEGRATRKFDGTACLIKDGLLFKRYDCKKGRMPPEGFVAADEPDGVTGHWPGWVPVQVEDRWHREAFVLHILGYGVAMDGTYELLFPRFQGRDSSHINPENVSEPMLVRHGESLVFPPTPIEFETLKQYFNAVDFEGIVWHHPDGRMAKIKSRDFGIKRI